MKSRKIMKERRARKQPERWKDQSVPAGRGNDLEILHLWLTIHSGSIVKTFLGRGTMARFDGVVFLSIVSLLLCCVCAGANEKKGQSWALIIGINKYQQIGPLRGCRQDAEALAEVLVGRCGFTSERLVVLTDDAEELKDVPTLGTMRGRIKQFTAFPRRGDSVLIFFAGHGVTIEGKDYLVPLDGSVDSENAMSLQWVKSRLAKCKAATKVLALDMCRPGSERAVGSLGLDLEAEPGMTVFTSCAEGRNTLAADAPTREGAMTEQPRQRKLVSVPVTLQHWIPYKRSGYKWQPRSEYVERLLKKASSEVLVLDNAKVGKCVWAHKKKIAGDFGVVALLAVQRGSARFGFGNFFPGVHRTNGREFPLPEHKRCRIVLERHEGEMKCWLNGEKQELRRMIYGGSEEVEGCVAISLSKKTNVVIKEIHGWKWRSERGRSI
jgi:hypothetical protein